jgi:hypothetical protein
MKSNIPNTLYKLLTLIPTVSTLTLATHSAWAGDQVPFKGVVRGAAVGVAPDPAGVVLTL